MVATPAVAGTAGVGEEPEDRPRHTARWVAGALGVVAVLLVVLLATRQPATTRLADSPLLGRPAPALAGPSLVGGADFDLAGERGRYVLVNFFATWCSPCVREHDDLRRFSDAHAAAGDVRVVSVVFDDKPSDVAAFFEREGGTWPVIANEGGRATIDFGVTGVPESYLVGPEGAVRAKIIGGIDAERLENLLSDVKGS
jgi:cytochrome c biogenesis protein CcmG/thiol:disulfide interchange protein DsbE